MNIISSNKVKTRKAHNCWGCTTLFPVGSDMQLVKCEDNGKAYSVYWCNDCQSILEKDYYPDDIFCYGELKENMK